MLPRPLCMSWNDQAHKQLHISLSLRPGVKDINIGKNRLFTKKNPSNGLKEIAKGYKLSYLWEIAWSVFMLLSLCGPQIYPREIVHLFWQILWARDFYIFRSERSIRKGHKVCELCVLWTLWCPLSLKNGISSIFSFKKYENSCFCCLVVEWRFTPKFGSVTAWGQIKLCCAV